MQEVLLNYTAFNFILTFPRKKCILKEVFTPCLPTQSEKEFSMDLNRPRPLLLQQCGAFVSRRWKEYRLPFLAAILFGLLAYAFAFTNKLLNHDEAFSLFMKGATVDSGRWGLGLLDSIFPNISMPWIYGMMSIGFIAIAICLILRIFSIQSRLLQVLLAGCVMVFPSLIGLFGYMFTSCSFALAFLLAVLAVWFLHWDPKKGLIPGFGCMVFSLSIYQSYVSLAAGLLVLILIQRLLKGERVPSVILSGVFYVGFLAVSLGAYFAATQVFLKLLHVEMNSYASGNVSFSPLSIPANILLAYQSFFRYFTEGFRGLLPTSLSRLSHILFLAATALLLILWGLGQQKKEIGRYVLLAALLALLPLAINCMYLFTIPESIHTLVLYGFVSVYILAVIVGDICLLSGKDALLKGILLDAATLSMAVVILINLYVANAAYLNLHLRYENAYSFYASLSAQIKSMPEFQEDTKLAILGTFREPDFYTEHFSFLQELTGVKGFLPDSYSRGKFLEYYLDFPIPSPTEEETAAILRSPEYAEMAVYPYYGSLRLIGDTIVVKLSEPSE